MSPWTDDETLLKYKFTNVFRDQDPGTQYVIKKIIPNAGSKENIIFNIIIYRLYNKIETMEHVKLQNYLDFDEFKFEQKLRELKAKKIPDFTNAFTVSSYNWVNSEKDKIANTSTVIKWIADDLESITKDLLEHKDSEFTYKRLLSLKGLGTFLAYQIAVDIGYWKKEIFDEDKYTVAGPGCKRGINYIFEDKKDLSYEECIFYIEKNQDEYFNKFNINREILFSDRKEKRLNIMALENCFCEISKYIKAYNNEGRTRN